MYVIKKDGTREQFDVQKIIRAVNKSAARAMYTFSEEETKELCRYATERAEGLKKDGITIAEMHNIGKRPGESESRCGKKLSGLSKLQSRLYSYDG